MLMILRENGLNFQMFVLIREARVCMSPARPLLRLAQRGPSELRLERNILIPRISLPPNHCGHYFRPDKFQFKIVVEVVTFIRRCSIFMFYNIF